MPKSRKLSRRQFVTSAMSAAAVASVGVPKMFSRVSETGRSSLAEVTLTDMPPWRDQAIENLTKSPHAKLRQIPVHAVTIKNGFWGRRR